MHDCSNEIRHLVSQDEERGTGDTVCVVTADDEGEGVGGREEEQELLGHEAGTGPVAVGVDKSRDRAKAGEEKNEAGEGWGTEGEEAENGEGGGLESDGIDEEEKGPCEVEDPGVEEDVAVGGEGHGSGCVGAPMIPRRARRAMIPGAFCIVWCMAGERGARVTISLGIARPAP